MKGFIFFIVLFMCLSGCGFVYERHLTGNYYLIAIDAMEDMSISYYEEKFEVYLCEGGNSVYEVGFDENFITTKKYRELPDSLRINLVNYDKDITEYYIIPVDNPQASWEAQDNCFGPLTQQEFETKKKEPGVSDSIAFKKI